jgi:hypothetical protein
VLPPPYTATRRPTLGRSPDATLRKNDTEAAVAALRLEILDPMTLRDAHTELFDAADLDVQDVSWQAIGWDSVPHHAARLLARIPDVHLVT